MIAINHESFIANQSCFRLAQRDCHNCETNLRRKISLVDNHIFGVLIVEYFTISS